MNDHYILDFLEQHLINAILLYIDSSAPLPVMWLVWEMYLLMLHQLERYDGVGGLCVF